MLFSLAPTNVAVNPSPPCARDGERCSCGRPLDPRLYRNYRRSHFRTTVDLPSATAERCRFELHAPNGAIFHSVESVEPHSPKLLDAFAAEFQSDATVITVSCTGVVEVHSRIHESLDGGLTYAEGPLFRAVVPEPLTNGAAHKIPITADFIVAEIGGAAAHVTSTLTATASNRVLDKAWDLPPFGEHAIRMSDALRTLGPMEANVRVIGKGKVVILSAITDPTLRTFAQRAPEAVRAPLTAQVRAVNASSSPAGPSVTQQLATASFKASPFQEPMTGIIMMRDRWYDPTTGTFLTPDPEGYRDSPNLYMFAGGDPVNYSDPTGRYQADFHYGMTFFLAQQAGFCADMARRIAAGAEMPDQDPGRAPVTQGKVMKSWSASDTEKNEAQDMLWQWHFPKAYRNSGDVVPGSAEAQKIIADGLKRGSLALFAQGIHPLQDSWSHRGTPSLDGVAGHPKARGGLLSTKTDQPWRWPIEALQAAEATYNYLVAYRIRYPNQAGNCGRAPAPWASVASQADAYIRLRTKSDKRAWLLTHGITMPGTYWDDVDD